MATGLRFPAYVFVCCIALTSRFGISQETVNQVQPHEPLEKLEKLMNNFQPNSDKDLEWRDQLEELLHSVRKGKDLQNMLQEIMNDKASENGSEYHVSTQCIGSLLEWFHDIDNRSFYALQMLDAWARPGSGVLEGNVRWPGHYYECMTAKSVNFSGQWCVTYMGDTHPVEHPGIPLVMMWGSCFPSVCSTNDVAAIVQRLKEGRILPEILSTTCPNPMMRIETIDIVAIVICVLLVTPLILGTAFDIHSRYHPVKEKEPKGKLMKMLLCFSVARNAQQIVSTKQGRGNIPTLDGIRVISTTWVILSHCFYMPMNMIDNPVYSNKYYQQHGELQALANGTLAVDSFFFLSGLLVSYIVLQRMRKSGGSIDVLRMYLHRYLRLTPVYAFLLVISMSLYKFMGSGPFWTDLASKMYHSCADGNIWIFNLLYVNNLFPAEPQVCIGWAWYLANDMQFYVLAPIFLYVIYRWKLPGVALMVGVLLGSVVVTAVLSYDMNMQPAAVGFGLLMSIYGRFFPSTDENISYTERYKTDTYTTPWCRIGVYLVGMLTGWLLYLKQRKLQFPKVVVLVGWISSTTVALLLVYGTYDAVRNVTTMPIDLATFYVSVCRPVWGFCLTWVILACTSGYGGWITKFLNWKMFVPFSRLSYTAYLIHLLVVYWFMCTQESMLHLTLVNITYIYLGTLVITYMLAFVAAVAVEWPFMGLVKVIMGGKKETKSAAPYALQTRL